MIFDLESWRMRLGGVVVLESSLKAGDEFVAEGLGLEDGDSGALREEVED